MKCVKLQNEVQRVSDSQVDAMIKRGWALCPKKEWKAKNQKGAAAVPAEPAATTAPAAAGPAPKKSYKDKIKKRKAEDLSLPA